MTTSINQLSTGMGRSATGKDRITALDGLRAVALLIIMGFHFGVGWLQGGFFSLDIFYVLSGYLITGLLLGEYRKRAGIALSAFWLRRARRLLPALLVVLAVVTLYVRFVAPPGLYPEFRMSALSALFYFSNWWQIGASGNYFVATRSGLPAHPHVVPGRRGAVLPGVAAGGAGGPAPLALVRPGVRNVLVLSVAGTIASATAMALLFSPTANLTRLYFGTDTHAQSILLGSVLACTLTMVQMRRGAGGMAPAATTAAGRRLLTALGIAGFAGTFALTYALRGTSGFDYRGGFLLSAVLGGGHHRRCGVRAGRADRPALVAAPADVDRHRLLRRLPLALPRLHLRRHRPHRPDGSPPAGPPLRRDARPGRGQLLPGRAPGHVRRLLADPDGHRPGHGGLLAATVAVVVAGSVVPAPAPVVTGTTLTASEHVRPGTGRGLHHASRCGSCWSGTPWRSPSPSGSRWTASATTACSSSTGRPSGATSTTSR